MAGFLSDNFIQRVLDETDIVSLIDSFVILFFLFCLSNISSKLCFEEFKTT